MSIHDCEVQHFRSGGKGGQNQNKRDTGTRVIHHPSGARGEARDERSQLQNKRLAFRRMVDSKAFRLWVAIETGRIVARQAEIQAIDIPADQVRVEVRQGGRWVEVDPGALDGC